MIKDKDKIEPECKGNYQLGKETEVINKYYMSAYQLMYWYQ